MTSQGKNAKEENPSTYVIYKSKRKELERLVLQEQMITTAMGGPLPEQVDSTSFHHILDIGCGTGGWILALAHMYPQMHLTGVDINPYLLEYASEQAQAACPQAQIEFKKMDVISGLDFPDNSFDLVNLRLGMSFVRTWDWPKVLFEMQRVTCPGGVIRLTECEATTQNTSPALTQLSNLGILTMHRAGYLFAEKSSGLLDYLPELLKKSRCEQVQTKAYFLEFRAGTAEGAAFQEDMKNLHYAGRPFVQKWSGIPTDYDSLFQQTIKEMERPDFCATWHYLTVWGRKPL